VLSVEDKARLVYGVMLKYNYARSYNIVEKVDGKSRALTFDDVTTCIYINDEIGSAVSFNNKSGMEGANAQLSHLLVVTLDGRAFTLLWLQQDVNYQDLITVPTPSVKIPPPKQKKRTTTTTTAAATTAAQ
jgi:hypothetical protein